MGHKVWTGRDHPPPPPSTLPAYISPLTKYFGPRPSPINSSRQAVQSWMMMYLLPPPLECVRSFFATGKGRLRPPGLTLTSGGQQRK
jgi:hypothetical protein